MDQFTRRIIGFGVHAVMSMGPPCARCSTQPFLPKVSRGSP